MWLLFLIILISLYFSWIYVRLNRSFLNKIDFHHFCLHIDFCICIFVFLEMNVYVLIKMIRVSYLDRLLKGSGK